MLANFLVLQCLLFQFSTAMRDGSRIVFSKEGRDNSEGCLTVQGTQCIFPFKFGGVVYNKCITKEDPEQRPWCSTKIDEEGVHISGGGFWGHCKLDSCPFDTVTEAFNQGEQKTPCEATLVDGSSRRGTCKAHALCNGLSDTRNPSNICELSKGPDETGQQAFGICCPDLLSSTPTIRLTPTKVAKKNPSVSFRLPPSEVENAIEKRFYLIQDGLPGEAQRFNFQQQEQQPVTDDAVNFHLRFNQPSPGTLELDFKAGEFVDTASNIQATHNLSSSEAGIGLRFFDAGTSTRINTVCPWTPAPNCNSRQRYRNSDGTCNNLKEPNFGRATTPYQRILIPEYSQGSLQLPRKSKIGNLELPSAREISNRLTTDSNQIDNEFTVFVMQMGQFIDHDLTHTPTHRASCCGPNGEFPSSFDGAKCHPILIPRTDPFWQGRKTCLSMARSLSAPGLKCELEFRQQMNQITHWLDGSNIYGSSLEDTQKLRSNINGRLRMSPQSDSAKGGLPICSQAPSGVSMCSGCGSCFFTGDVRANEQSNLLAMHTLWIREHNRIAGFLKKLNPQWDDEMLFQEARRIVVAEYQHIIYKEWLPSVLGNKFMDTYGLWPQSKGYSEIYLDTFDPRITNEFAAAAFRFGHSLIPGRLRSVSRGRTSRAMDLKDIFFKPQQVQTSSAIDGIVKGMAQQEGSLWDNSFTPDLRNHLFESRRGAGGLDLVAINIQRGRDHGLPGYNSYRETCQFSKAKSFDDLKDVMNINDIQKLKTFYKHVDDIDLFVGGFLEQKHGDSILGPVFKCIIGDQFARLKIGDRFFYDLGKDPKIAFTPEQLQEIRKTSMSRIICENTDSIVQIQPLAFKQVSNSNRETSCFSRSIPFPNFSVFKQLGRTVG